MTDAQFERQGMRWREVGAQHQLVLIGISKIADALKPDADFMAESVPIPGGIAPDGPAIFRRYIDEIEHQCIRVGERGFQHQPGSEEILIMANLNSKNILELILIGTISYIYFMYFY